MDQLSFDGFPIRAQTVSVSTSGTLDYEDVLGYQARVRVVGEGYVAKVTILNRDGVTTRHHAIVLEEVDVRSLRAETTEEELDEPFIDDPDEAQPDEEEQEALALA